MNSSITQTDGQIVGREEPSVAVEVGRFEGGEFQLENHISRDKHKVREREEERKPPLRTIDVF